MTNEIDEQLSQWRSAIGRRDVRTQYLDADSARRYAVAVGLSPDTSSALVHWSWFLDVVPDSGIGLDGHPKRGAFLPNISLPRRMFASSKMRFSKPLALEQNADINIEIVDIARKTGKQGELIFVTIEREIIQAGVVCVTETQTLLYRDMGDTMALPVPANQTSQVGDERWTPNTVSLFRFSSVTFNSHRIHYDQQYARDAEGYPDLIVHGPFTATKLADLAARSGALISFEFRGLAPLFQGQTIILRQTSEEVFHALRCDGVVAVEAKVSYQ